MSLMCAETQNLFALRTCAGIRMLRHPAFSHASEEEVRLLLAGLLSDEQVLDVLCVERAIASGPRGTGRCYILSGTGVPVRTWVKKLGVVARHVVALGTCADFGGVTTAGGNPSDSVGLQYDGAHPGGIIAQDFRSRSGLPVISIAGCPTHPGWVTETLLLLDSGTMTEADLDALARPQFYADHLVHHTCPKNEFYDYKASARVLSQMGCTMEHLGCVSAQAVGDCNIRPWNGKGSCTRGGYPCIACISPEFEEPRHAFAETPKVAGIPVGLTSDVPKAWLTALASLSKAATPARVATNAVSDRIAVPPTLRKPRR